MSARWVARGATVVLVATALTLPALADTYGSRQRTTLFKQQSRLLDDLAGRKQGPAIPLAGSTVVTPSKWPDDPPVRYKGRYRGIYLQLARDMARRHGIPEDLFLRLVEQESGWNPRARSPKGAIGLAQLMPFTARKLGVNPHDPAQNLEGGARYLSAQYRRFRSWRLALAAYNAGPEAVEKYGGVPPYRETRAYVKAILGGWAG